MIYKFSKSKVVVATLLLLTAKTMNNATLATQDNTIKKAWASAKPFIHQWTPITMMASLALMIDGWHKGNEKHLVYGAIGVSKSVVISYVGRPSDFSPSAKWFKKHAPYEPPLVIASLVCLAVYVVFKLIPAYCSQDDYFGLDKKFNLEAKHVKIFENSLMAACFISSMLYFVPLICACAY